MMKFKNTFGSGCSTLPLFSVSWLGGWPSFIFCLEAGLGRAGHSFGCCFVCIFGNGARTGDSVKSPIFLWESTTTLNINLGSVSIWRLPLYFCEVHWSQKQRKQKQSNCKICKIRDCLPKKADVEQWRVLYRGGTRVMFCPADGDLAEWLWSLQPARGRATGLLQRHYSSV